jgi:regulator of sirC expression with transglutaminase-like and TPR domain
MAPIKTPSLLLKTFVNTFLILGLPCLSLEGEVFSEKLKALYNSLDPTSISQHLAFYELYSNTPEGQRALQEAYRLLTGTHQADSYVNSPPSFLSISIESLIALVNKHPNDQSIDLSEGEQALIEKLANRLSNRRLPGYYIHREEDLKMLNPEQIDLARGVLLSQLGDRPDAMRKIKSYEAAIDLMALQILTKISLEDSPKVKIRAINRFIFEEMGFRFPPHSIYAKDIDLYTFLPSVLDSRRGVCLGVSILYICLAQRLNLHLEIVTPPGHIFVRWRNGKDTINIETTARGIHLPDEEYLGIETRSLQQRNIKETIGMAHFNQASVFWEREEYDQAIKAYTKAKPYLPADKQLLELMGYIALLQGDEEKGKTWLQQVVDDLPEYAVSKHSIAEDYLHGKATIEGIKAIFMHVDETRESLLKKRQALEKALEKSPYFNII